MEAPREGAKKSLRYRLGLVLFFGAFPMPFVAPAVIPWLGFSAAQSAGLIGSVLLVSELLLVCSVPLLGREGFNALKARLLGWLKLPEGPIGRQRHRFGVALLLGCLFADMLVTTAIVASSLFVEGARDPATPVLGLDFEQHLTLFVGVELSVTLGLVAALFLLGAEFWEKLKMAFEWQGATP